MFYRKETVKQLNLKKMNKDYTYLVRKARVLKQETLQFIANKLETEYEGRLNLEEDGNEFLAEENNDHTLITGVFIEDGILYAYYKADEENCLLNEIGIENLLYIASVLS